jgi:hypothetical protein
MIDNAGKNQRRQIMGLIEHTKSKQVSAIGRSPLEHSVALRAKHAYTTSAGRHYVVDVDSVIAQAMLNSTPTFQRKLDVRRAVVLQAAMEAGKWTHVADPIRLDANASLVDGQHRMYAIATSIKSVVLVDVQVVFLNPVAGDNPIHVIDNGKSRTQADYMKMSGYTVPASHIRAGLLFEAMDFKPAANVGLSRPEQAEAVAQHPLLQDAQLLPRAPSGIVAGAVRCMRHDRDRALEFFEAVLHNRHEIRGRHSKAAQILATWILAGQGAKYSGHSFQRECAYRAIRAFKAHIHNENVHHFKYDSTYVFPTLP